MSLSDMPDSSRFGVLRINAPEGVIVEVQDGSLKTVAQMLGNLEVQLPAGLYAVRLSAAGYAKQETVILRGGDEVSLNRDQFLFDDNDTHTVSGRHAIFKHILYNLNHDSRLKYESKLCVVVELEGLSFEPSLDVIVQNSQLSTLECGEAIAERFFVMSTPVAEGTCLLRYRISAEQYVEQVVYAFRHRTTVVILRPAQKVLKKSQWNERAWSADPSRTVIFSQDIFQEDGMVNLRFAEILLHELVQPQWITNSRNLILSNPYPMVFNSQDPYLYLYSMAVAISYIGKSKENHIERHVFYNILDHSLMASGLYFYYENDREYYRIPSIRDIQFLIVAADLLIQELDINYRERYIFKRTFTQTEFRGYPMLDLAWRWACFDSVRAEGARLTGKLPTESSLLTYGPWLLRALNDLPDIGKEIIDERFALLADLLSHLTIKDSRFDGGERLSASILGQLSLRSRRIVEMVFLHFRKIQHDSIGWPQRGNESRLARIAFEIGQPLAVLGDDAATAIREVEDLVREAEQHSELALPDFRDTNQGKFGGISERDGYVLTLEGFTPIDDGQYLALDVKVTDTRGGSRRSREVMFTLHPSFDPMYESVSMVDGAAHYVIYSWGVFTLGARTQDGTRLELDLAKSTVLPESFRLRPIFTST